MKRKRMLDKISDYELTNFRTIDLAEKYFVSKSSVVAELRRRGLVNKFVYKVNITATVEDFKNHSLLDLSIRENTTVTTIKKYALNTHGITSEQLKEMRALRTDKTKFIETISDEEFEKSVRYINKMYKLSYSTIKEERERRGIASNKARIKTKIRDASDEELFGLSLKELTEKYETSIDTVARERRRRREQ